MKNRIRIARGTKADLQGVTENIPVGVPIYTTDENKLYIGQEGKKGNELEAVNCKKADNSFNSVTFNDTANKTFINTVDDLYTKLKTGVISEEQYYEEYEAAKQILKNSWDSLPDTKSSPVLYSKENNSIVIPDPNHQENINLYKIKIVNSLPTTQEENVIYLVKLALV